MRAPWIRFALGAAALGLGVWVGVGVRSGGGPPGPTDPSSLPAPVAPAGAPIGAPPLAAASTATPAPVAITADAPSTATLAHAPAPKPAEGSLVDSAQFRAGQMKPTPAVTVEIAEHNDVRTVRREGKDFKAISFGLLAGFPFRTPDRGVMAKDAKELPTEFQGQVPPSVRELSGSEVALQGFIVPLEVERSNVKTFVLVRSQLFCCYGATPAMNEWVHVKMEPGTYAPFTQDVPVTVYGKLDVGETIRRGTLISLYRMRSIGVEVEGRGLY